MGHSQPADSSPGIGSAIDETRPLGVYVHVPFCTTRCPYCDFAVTVKRDIPHDPYAEAVSAELRTRGPAFAGHTGSRLRSIYFGGGTPALWRPGALGRVLEAIRERFGGHEEPEITVEANPGDLDPDALVELRALGVNRLSFGAQAFQDRLLRRLGRRHSADAVATSIAAARRAGFENLCVDLMFGLPDQSMHDWQASLDALAALRPAHITAYALTVESGTRFGALERAGQLDRPSDEEVAAMYAVCHERLSAAGYEHYEISSYALPGRRSRHNTLYWTMGAYLGLGPSAASFLPLVRGDGWRCTNPRSLSSYLQRIARTTHPICPETADHRSAAELEAEALWLGLRTSDGVDRRAHACAYGHDPLALPGREAAAVGCSDAGWLEISSDRLRLLPPQGFLFADEVAVRLWGEPAKGREEPTSRRR
jgi:oxygen-independent coproporphyrinogen-3 oxidase